MAPPVLETDGAGGLVSEVAKAEKAKAKAKAKAAKAKAKAKKKKSKGKNKGGGNDDDDDDEEEEEEDVRTLLGKTGVVKKSLSPVWADVSDEDTPHTFVVEGGVELGGGVLIEVWDAGGTFLGEVGLKGERIGEMLAKKGRSQLTKLLRPKAGRKEKKWSK